MIVSEHGKMNNKRKKSNKINIINNYVIHKCSYENQQLVIGYS